MAVLCLGFGAIGLAACAASAQRPLSASRPAPKDTRIVHEDCPLDDPESVREDINGDGRPDRTTVSRQGRVICRALDFNFDGVIDAWIYFDAAGNVRRREADYDRDGRVDEIALYRAGQLVERQRATGPSGKLDTWQYYRDGRLVNAERDSNGDDYVDQWWEYPEGRGTDCPLIHSDVNGDGRPDPGATVDVCRDSETRRQATPGPARSDRVDVGDLPHDVESPGANAEGAAPASGATRDTAAPSRAHAP